jgi:hypothetical protein
MISLPPGTEHLPLDVREGIQCLFVLLRSHSDPRRALDAALKAVVNLGVTPPSTQELVVIRPDNVGPGPADPARYVEETPVAGATKLGEDGNPASPPLPYSLDCYPKCKSLIEHYNLAAPAKKKNPLLILNEYANKLNLEVRGYALFCQIFVPFLFQLCLKLDSQLANSGLVTRPAFAHLRWSDPCGAIFWKLLFGGLGGNYRD